MYRFTVKNMNIILNKYNFEYNFEINQLFIFTKNNFTAIFGNLHSYYRVRFFYENMTLLMNKP